MIAVNDLSALNMDLGADALQPLAVLLSPYAPHLAEELWAAANGSGSVLDAAWPEALQVYLTEDQITYPVSFNGKVRFQLALAASLSAQDVESAVRQDERTEAQLAVIVVPGRIVNVVA
jgi:leucyl-tRNA synthetase